MEANVYEAIIVGGGPAGLSAALTLGRTHRTVLLLDSGRGRNAAADATHNLFTRDGAPPEQLCEIGRDQLSNYPSVKIRNSEAASAKEVPDVGFEVTLSDGSTAAGKRLLLASGLVDNLPNLPGAAPLWGSSVLNCPYCHGFEVSRKRIAVIGAEPDRAKLALHLSRFSDDVTLCTNGPAEFPPALQSALRKAGIEQRYEPISQLEGMTEWLETVIFESGPPLACDAAFIKAEAEQRSSLPEQLGCVAFDDRLIEVDESGQTSVSGVYAAGDMARRATVPIPQAAVIAAAASGTIAAVA
ncbi:MAG TPA: NAD(P)/FAD-dependent oxidoreductase, partial [Mycobacteriales bacterium]|nr:NAD(P)/FAD-dependent oxidoreductase [Mycobacteriales bacterium]